MATPLRPRAEYGAHLLVSTCAAVADLRTLLDQGMNATSPSDTLPAQAMAAGSDRSRLWAGLAAALFVPAFLVAVMVTLTFYRPSGCVTYGEQCGEGLPGWVFAWGVGLGAVMFVVALAAPALRVRQVALAAQLLAECTALLVVLSYA
ncbi:hypothetical protein ACGFX2_31870 [Streptomyces goshikiensis]|uniref:hypothetical protein n=1 Tax=Streptomyces goshikiensis TaxID=1942 RepID=UPI00371E1D8D